MPERRVVQPNKAEAVDRARRSCRTPAVRNEDPGRNGQVRDSDKLSHRAPTLTPRDRR